MSYIKDKDKSKYELIFEYEFICENDKQLKLVSNHIGYADDQTMIATSMNDTIGLWNIQVDVGRHHRKGFLIRIR